MEKDYLDFVNKVLETGFVWGIESDEGFGVCESELNKNSDVYLFWSSKTKAQKVCIEEWSDYKVVNIPISEFVEDWLTGLKEDNCYAGVDWNADLEGLEIDPEELSKLL